MRSKIRWTFSESCTCKKNHVDTTWLAGYFRNKLVTNQPNFGYIQKRKVIWFRKLVHVNSELYAVRHKRCEIRRFYKIFTPFIHQRQIRYFMLRQTRFLPYACWSQSCINMISKKIRPDKIRSSHVLLPKLCPKIDRELQKKKWSNTHDKFFKPNRLKAVQSLRNNWYF